MKLLTIVAGSFIIMVIIFSIFFACEKIEPERIIKVETGSINNVNYNSCIAQGVLIDIGEKGIDQHGFCFSTEQKPTIDDYKTQLGSKSSVGGFSGSLIALSCETTYYVRAFATNSDGISYGSQLSFTTSQCPPSPPTVTTYSATDITVNSVTLGGNVSDEGTATVTARGVCWSIFPNPTLADSVIIVGSGTGQFNSSITGLTENTRYYVRAYATNSVGTAYGNEISFSTYGTVIDFDGNTYSTVLIGDQIWMAENLKVVNYFDGTPLQLTEDNLDWDGACDIKAYCYYNNDSLSNSDTYGILYNWVAAMNGESSSSANPSRVQGVCPDGWHLPSDAEWKELEMYLGMSQAEADGTDDRGTDEGNKLKEAGTVHWDSPNTGATNSSGFTGLPGGRRRYSPSTFEGIGTEGYWWSTTEATASYLLWTRGLNTWNSLVYRNNEYKCFANSVRCVKDND